MENIPALLGKLHPGVTPGSPLTPQQQQLYKLIDQKKVQFVKRVQKSVESYIWEEYPTVLPLCLTGEL